MINRVNSDGRLRGMFQYGGASTLRWAARGVQLHNQPRDSYGPETWEEVARLFREHDTEGITLLYDDPFYVASRCVRGSLCTKKGTHFICSDLNSIEAVGLAFLATLQLLPAVLVAAPLLLALIFKTMRAVWRGERLSNIDVQTAQFESALLVFLTVALILHGGM